MGEGGRASGRRRARRASSSGLGPVRRPYRKRFEPVGIDRWNPTVTRGDEPIPEGTIVMVVAHHGPFRTIQDDMGHEMAVGKGSLRSLGA